MKKDNLKLLVETIEKAERVHKQLMKDKKKVPGVVELLMEIMSGLDTLINSDQDIKSVVGSLIQRIEVLEGKKVTKKGAKNDK